MTLLGDINLVIRHRVLGGRIAHFSRRLLSRCWFIRNSCIGNRWINNRLTNRERRLHLYLRRIHRPKRQHPQHRHLDRSKSIHPMR